MLSISIDSSEICFFPAYTIGFPIENIFCIILKDEQTLNESSMLACTNFGICIVN